MEARPEWSLEECGLASLGVVQFANTLRSEFSVSGQKITLSAQDIMEARDILEIASIVDAARGEISLQSQGQVLQTT